MKFFSLPALMLLREFLRVFIKLLNRPHKQFNPNPFILSPVCSAITGRVALEAYKYYLPTMGNESCSFPRILSKDFEVPDLKERSFYGNPSSAKANDNIVRSVYNQSWEIQRGSMVAKRIEEHPEKVFVDDKFAMERESSRLAVLFDFQRMHTRIYSRKDEMDLTSFTQLNIEFSYLTCVFYLLCRREARGHLLRQLIQTQEANPYGAYSLTFFSNGQPHPLIIDDRMPTHNDAFLYLRIVKGAQLWPLIMEKAWCKQVGGYQRAKGLSPQDAFEEITGVPAYTFKFRADNQSIIKGMLQTALSQKYWVALVARNGLDDLKNRQVFYLEPQPPADSHKYLVISPFSTYRFNEYQQQRRGQIQIRQEDIFTHFEYAVVGFYREGYTCTSVPVDCKSHQQVLFEVTVERKESVSLRFNQFYEGYLTPEERINYQYSPVLIELYKVNEEAGVKGQYTLITDCQGCNRALSGARSVHCAKNILEELQGKYLLRIEVEWQHEELLHRGNLVAYSSEGNVRMVQLPNNGQMLREVYPQFFQRRLPKQDISVLSEHNLQVSIIPKLYTTLLSFRNLINSSQTFDIDFSKSTNLLIRGGTVKSQSTRLRIEGQQKSVIELLPRRIREGFSFQNFEITRVERDN